MLTVAELMTKSVVTLSVDETLAQAADTLSNLGVSGAPVCDADEKVVGVFSKSDLVGRLVDGKLDTSATVGSHMTKVTVSLRASDSVLRAAQVMAEKKIHRLVVVDDGGRLVGIVSPLDILEAVRDGRLELRSPG
ncbi:MAG: CBS domain-containing protein [Deltaproteobacteria bacterium]|nr:CBS domain-containing protein [Deltaproteobacteria bacterium]